jgi:hypothetical protein
VRFAVDFSLQLLHLFVDARELDAEIFTKLIDASAHDHSPYNFGNFYSAPRMCCLIWINLINLLGRFAHDAGYGARVTVRTLAAATVALFPFGVAEDSAMPWHFS